MSAPRDRAYVARQIGKTENWLRRNAPRLPHHRIGRTYVWTDDDIADILHATRVRPQGDQSDELRPMRRRSA